jgi:hypothetical protein
MAIIASVCANTNEIIMAVKTLGALEWLRPKALILAKLLAAKTAEGPRIQRAKMRIIARFRLIDYFRVVLL